MTRTILLDATLERIFSFFPLLSPIPRELIQHSDFPTFEALPEKVEQALLKFTNAPEEILALCSLPTELAQAA